MGGFLLSLAINLKQSCWEIFFLPWNYLNNITGKQVAFEETGI